jgi:hypothetical protein
LVHGVVVGFMVVVVVVGGELDAARLVLSVVVRFATRWTAGGTEKEEGWGCWHEGDEAVGLEIYQSGSRVFLYRHWLGRAQVREERSSFCV